MRKGEGTHPFPLCFVIYPSATRQFRALPQKLPPTYKNRSLSSYSNPAPNTAPSAVGPTVLL